MSLVEELDRERQRYQTQIDRLKARVKELEADRASHLLESQIDRLKAELAAARHNEEEIRKHLTCRIEAADRANAAYSHLLALIIRPWTRDGDGAEMFKVNLAWSDTAETYEEAVAMVERQVADMQRRRFAESLERAYGEDEEPAP